MRQTVGTRSRIEKNAALKWLAIFGAWLLVSVIFTSQFYAQSQLSRLPISLWYAFTLQFASILGWFALTPLVLWMGRRFPLSRRQLRKSLPAHMIFGAGIVFLQQLADALMIPMLGYPTHAAGKTYGQIYREFILLNFHVNFLIYWMIVGIQNALGFYREYRERELAAARLESQLARVRLQVLKNQLHPHFFFNTLNAVSALMYRSPKEAGRLIAQLGDLFRVSFKNDAAQEIPLKAELEFLRTFLQIHQTLMGKRLQIEWEIEPRTLDALVPNLILQPLAENAILHGLAPLEEGGRLTIYAGRENETLLLQVKDDGPGFASENGGGDNGGIGLANTRARLENLYNGRHKFSIQAAADKGATVKIEIPFREQAGNGA